MCTTRTPPPWEGGCLPPNEFNSSFTFHAPVNKKDSLKKIALGRKDSATTHLKEKNNERSSSVSWSLTTIQSPVTLSPLPAFTAWTIKHYTFTLHLRGKTLTQSVGSSLSTFTLKIRCTFACFTIHDVFFSSSWVSETCLRWNVVGLSTVQAKDVTVTVLPLLVNNKYHTHLNVAKMHFL